MSTAGSIVTSTNSPGAAEKPTVTAATVVLVLIVAATLLRSFVYLRYEQLAFDSDQAINGLMAKHLIEGRAFPLFFYGQRYLLAVESWAAAPFFLLAGPSVAALRASLFAWNVAFAFLVALTLYVECRLAWPAALLSVVPFLFAPPSVASQLMNAQGAIVEPFVFVVGLWLLRNRPLAFGALLAIGFRNREFVAYAVPAALAVEWWSGALTRSRVQQWLIAAVVFAAVWQSIEALTPLADLMGPGTRGQFRHAFQSSQLANLIDRFDWRPAALPGRTLHLVPQIVGWLDGARKVGSSASFPEHPWIAPLAAIFLVVIGARTALLVVSGGHPAERGISARRHDPKFALYLSAVGAIAIAAFVAARPALEGFLRYALLGLLLPLGLVASHLALEPAGWMRRLTAALVMAWALLMARDHLAFAISYVRHPDVDAPRLVADQLLSQGITTARSGYWNAYVMTFISRERLRVASSDFVRIQEYENQFRDRIDQAVVISDRPCRDGTPISRFYICRP